LISSVNSRVSEPRPSEAEKKCFRAPYPSQDFPWNCYLIFTVSGFSKSALKGLQMVYQLLVDRMQ